MVKVITYGTFDLLHFGHINLLKKAKELGDYLIVGVTADDFDVRRGKLSVSQTLVDRVQAVKATGLADEIIIEEYEGQKIDDIKKYGVDIFTVGSDWVGKFDYLNEFCKVIYLPRTDGISSTEERNVNSIKVGIVGEASYINKYYKECALVNGLTVTGIHAKSTSKFDKELLPLVKNCSYEAFLEGVDAVYIATQPRYHYEQIKLAIAKGKHVLCESPISITKQSCEELFELAKSKGCVLMESIKTAHSVAYNRLLLLTKMGEIGKVVSVDATCTSLINIEDHGDYDWNSLYEWGPTAMLPVFQILGSNYKSKNVIVGYLDKEKNFDGFTKISFLYDGAVASIKVGKGIKSEGELVISGTKGYVYVPAPWWKTDYFEIRYEDSTKNKRFFYQLEGEGIRHQFVSFAKSIALNRNISYISAETSMSIAKVCEDFNDKNGIETIEL
ncbi:MAG: adenylyltransferase/cytidyltransferase family protein [Clostridia bacterium]|nr:adenylyltransferase/cytidyltransferase family protein [Clostridia bacterium]